MIWPGGRSEKGENRLLEKYDFDSLAASYRAGEYFEQNGKFEIVGRIKEVEERRKQQNLQSSILNFQTRRFRFKSGEKWITGMINYFPERSSLSPVVIMIRGYADKEGYYSGSGSWRMADKLAEAGWATVSIDFLGFGGSDEEPTDMLEARFIKVVNVIDLIESVKKLPWVDKGKIGIWAHSNGGQIALSVLEVTGGNFPTVLWAPMTNPFPQSVLQTASDLEDEGRAVKAAIEKFEGEYDSRRYAVENYYQWIAAPIKIFQGTADAWCRVEWQKELQSRLRGLGKEVELTIFPGSDHNLSKDWKEAVGESIKFYDKYLKN